MRTHLTIIIDAGGHKALAAALGLPEERVRFWALRKSIPVEAWRALTHAQLSTLEELTAAAAARASEVHTLTKARRATKPAAVRCDDPAHAGVGK